MADFETLTYEAANGVATVTLNRPDVYNSFNKAMQRELRALWAGRELSRAQALSLGWAFVGLGTDQESIAEGQRAFTSGERATPRIR